MRAFLLRNPVIYLATTLWKFAGVHRRKVILYTTMSVAAMSLNLLGPLIIRELINSVQTLSGTALIERALWLLGLFIALDLIFWVLHGPSRVLERKVAFSIKREYQSDLLHKVTALPTRWQKAHHSGETIDQISKATQSLGDFAESSFEVLNMLTRYIGSVCFLIWFMPSAGFVIGSSTFLIVLIITLFDKRLVQQYRNLNKRFNEVAAAIQDYLTNIATIISLRLATRVNREVYDRTTKIGPLYNRNAALVECKWFTTSQLVTCTQAGVLAWYILGNVSRGTIVEVGTLYALWEYLRGVGETFFQFTWKYGDLVVKSARVRAVEHITEAYARDVQGLEEAILPTQWQSIAIQKLSFAHSQVESGDEITAQVRNIDLMLERGKSYAFVGESGCGKSTTLGLIRGLHQPDAVSVHCDGAPLPFGLAHVSHCTTLIPQDPEIFSDTIRFNVTMGVEAEERDVMHAIRAAQFEPVLIRLPKGLETSIAEKGVNLSGGEKQRLALARGLFFARDSQIVLLDEPTSSVDPFNERVIYETLLEAYRSRCVISSIHKFNLLHYFDEIVVFKQGRIVERGTIDTLTKAGGEFVRLQRQSDLSV
jgi:ATP-binding cassette subfamily B protein